MEIIVPYQGEIMNRQLLLISNPGNPNENNYVRTTETAIDRWESFFRSPIGGYWQDDEIMRYGENNQIDAYKFQRLLTPLNTVQYDYSMVGEQLVLDVYTDQCKTVSFGVLLVEWCRHQAFWNT